MEQNYIQQIKNLIKNTKFKNNFIKSILLALEPNFRLYDSKIQNEILHFTKKRLKEDLIELNLYLNLDNKLRLKKNDIYINLNSQNLYIEEYTKQFICHYFNINIIVINQNTKKHRCIINYNPDWFSIILINEKNNYIPLVIDKLLTDNDIQIILKEFVVDELFVFRNETDITLEEKEKIAKINKLKISELKDIAIEYDIDIYKVSTANTKNKFKTKNELSEEIKNYIINQNNV
jgi:hypothetical protein